VIGKSDYRAYAGCCTWLNGAYWLSILDNRPDGTLIVENLHDVGKKKLPKVSAPIEPDLVYPLLRGRDVSRWKAQPSAYLLLAQNSETRNGWEEEMMKERWPKTHDYLKQLERPLRARSGYKKYFDPEKDPFYTMYNVGPYTLAPYKVIWKEQASLLTCAVCSSAHVYEKERKITIPDHKLMLVPFEEEAEAHYVCTLLNSSPSQLVVKSYVIETSTSTHVLDHVRIPKFEKHNSLHDQLASLSQEAHQFAAGDEHEQLRKVEEEIDGKAATLWGITDEELADIKISLGELV